MHQSQRPMTVQLILLVITIGLFAGILSGLIGIGGGIVLVPALAYFLHYNQYQAQGTSLGVLSFPVVLVAFLKYYFDLKKQGAPIDFKVVGLLAVGFIVGGYFGSTLALRLDKELLKKIFAVILFYTAFKMLNWDAAIVRFLRGIF
jgi:uncharacterized membrane protein YfcA